MKLYKFVVKLFVVYHDNFGQENHEGLECNGNTDKSN